MIPKRQTSVAHFNPTISSSSNSNSSSSSSNNNNNNSNSNNNLNKPLSPSMKLPNSISPIVHNPMLSFRERIDVFYEIMQPIMHENVVSLDSVKKNFSLLFEVDDLMLESLSENLRGYFLLDRDKMPKLQNHKAQNLRIRLNKTDLEVYKYVRNI